MEGKTRLWLRDNAWRVLDSVVDSIVIIDSAGVIQHINEATLNMFGYAEEELLDAFVTKLMPEPESVQHQKYIEHYLQSGKANIIGVGRELMAQSKQGKAFPMYLSISEISSGNETFFAGVMHDLSEQKAANAKMLDQQSQLAHAGRLSTMGELTASIAHEINQPLTAISLYAQACIRLLQNDEINKQKLSVALDKLGAQSLRAGTIIERIQRFMRKEPGEKEQVDLNALVFELRPLAEGDARLHGIELEFSLAQDLEPIYCDTVQIQQVALNLIRNAVDAMSEIQCRQGNVILIETSSVSEGGIQVKVVDSGNGVPAEQQEQIFSPFHTTKSDGMGMGLSICRSIIELHGGVLNFKNNAEENTENNAENNAEKGVSFYFQLPVGQPTRDAQDG